MDGTPLKASDPLLGNILGDRYRLVARIGAGGMGTVYRAEHVVLRKRMAVKVLRPELSGDEDLVRRFQQEAIAASQIGQENIVDVIDFGRTPHGALYYVMEELDGASLSGLLEAGPLPIARTVVLLSQICRALGAAHGRGIVHRDLKPDNVMVVRRDDGSDFVKVLDFGIAKSPSVRERGRVTRAGTVIGTPEYMAPEQGAAATVDHRADIYAFGVLAYELLTGKLPFVAETPVATMIEHQTRAPVPPRQLRPEIPAKLEALVLKALAKRADARQQTMTAVAAELAEAMEEAGLPPAYEHAATPARSANLPTPGEVALMPLDVGPGTPGRASTRRGATRPIEVPVRPITRRREGEVSRGAPRRGRVAVAAVLTAALVIAAIAAATWRSNGPAPAPRDARPSAPPSEPRR